LISAEVNMFLGTEEAMENLPVSCALTVNIR
jgi:hypothetical protein